MAKMRARGPDWGDKRRRGRLCFLSRERGTERGGGPTPPRSKEKKRPRRRMRLLIFSLSRSLGPPACIVPASISERDKHTKHTHAHLDWIAQGDGGARGGEGFFTCGVSKEGKEDGAIVLLLGRARRTLPRGGEGKEEDPRPGRVWFDERRAHKSKKKNNGVVRTAGVERERELSHLFTRTTPACGRHRRPTRWPGAWCRPCRPRP